jgi:hypothetical protein
MKANKQEHQATKKGKASVMNKNRRKREVLRDPRYQDDIPQIETVVRTPMTPKNRTPGRRTSMTRPIGTYLNDKYCTPRSQIRSNSNLRAVAHQNSARDAFKQKLQIAVGEESETTFEDGPINLVVCEKPAGDSTTDRTNLIQTLPHQIGRAMGNPTTQRPPPRELTPPRKTASGRQPKRTARLDKALKDAEETVTAGRARQTRTIRG